MAPPTTTTWHRKAHTEGKHLLLRHYLERWLPIVGRHNEKILFVDGFAGPGRYAGGEDGSPVVAMRALVEHRACIPARVVFVFIEKDKARYEHLKNVVDEWHPKLPSGTEVHVFEDNFSAFLTNQLDSMQETGATMAPAFVMIDPFGIKGSEMTFIKRIFETPKCEVYSTFMWRFIRRFRRTEGFEKALTSFYGTTEWKKCRDRQGSEQRAILYDLYKKRLKQAGAEQVLDFHLYEGQDLDLHRVHGRSTSWENQGVRVEDATP